MTDRPRDELPEHERRPETTLGGGITGKGGTARETGPDRRAAEAGFDEERPRPTSDIDDPDPQDPDGPKAAYRPRNI
jgi:hypothetical protein